MNITIARGGLLVAALVAMASVVAGQQTVPATAPAGNVEDGRRLYMEYTCYYCHGTVGQGGLATVGPRVALVPRSLESFAAYVRRPTGRMSAYSEKVLPDAALADIYAYLRAQAPAKAARDLPLLESLRKPRG